MGQFELRAPKGATKKRKIVGRGRGSGRGNRAGKGDKGQNSRSGGGVRPGFEGGQMPLFRRIARRGFSNYPFKKEYTVINVGEVAKRFGDGTVVDRDSLARFGLVKRHAGPIKLLGDGAVDKKLTVKVEKVSRSAREKIEQAGGTVVEEQETQVEAHGE
jgi:large subunit ribosomal protein L15